LCLRTHVEIEDGKCNANKKQFFIIIVFSLAFLSIGFNYVNGRIIVGFIWKFSFRSVSSSQTFFSPLYHFFFLRPKGFQNIPGKSNIEMYSGTNEMAKYGAFKGTKLWFFN
jgi:hypothetical protein